MVMFSVIVFVLASFLRGVAQRLLKVSFSVVVIVLISPRLALILLVVMLLRFFQETVVVELG